MSRLGPLYAALAIFPLVAAGAALPYVALVLRRRGALGAGQIALAALFGLYLVGLAFVVVLPLRPVGPDFCDLFGVSARLDPLHVVDQARTIRAQEGWGAVLRNRDVLDVPLNVLLFIPLGMLLRYLLRRGIALVVAIGFLASLLIELTQLTGNWGLYPCAYRFFSTSDLITNTAGAGIGAALAPLLRWVPAQAPAADPAKPQPVAPARRFLAALSNAALIAAAGFALLAICGLLLDATRGQLFASDSFRAQALRAFALVLAPGTAVLLLAPLAWQGRTPGEWAALLRPVAAGSPGDPPSPALVVARFASVQAPMLLAAAAGLLGFEPAWIALFLFAALQALLVLSAREAGGGVKLRLGIQITDSRGARSSSPSGSGPGGPAQSSSSYSL